MNFTFRGRIFTFRDRREEGMMSNRAERLSDRAKRGSDSVARLDSPSDRRSRKGKYNQGKKEVRPSLYFLYWPYSCLRRDTFFCSDTICPTISLLLTHYLLNYFGLLFLLPFIEYYRSLMQHASFIIENFACSKIFNYKISMNDL